MISLVAPDVGSIVGCWFPYNDTTPITPGLDFRPCLVLEVIKKINSPYIYLLVCYGTGQTSDSNKGLAPSWAIEIESGDNNTLPETTRFNLRKSALLPLEDKFFKHPSKTNPFLRMGGLTKTNLNIISEKLEQEKISIEKTTKPTTCVITRKISSKKQL